MPRLASGKEITVNLKKVERLKAAVERFQDKALVERSSVRDYQSSALSAVSAFLERAVGKIESGRRASGTIIMPGGSGKTVVAAEIARAIGLRAMILAPTVKIAFQDYQELMERTNLKTSIYYAGRKDLSGQVIVTTYQSAVNLMHSGELPEDIDIVFYDEAHRSISRERSKLHNILGDIEIGLTATPAYNEDKHIWNIFDEKIYEMDLREGIELGVLSPVRGFVVETNVDLSDVNLKMGREFLNEAAAEKYLNILARNKTARDFYIDGFKGVPAIAFCVTRKHAEDFARYLRKSGVKAKHIHGGIAIPKREKILKRFEDGSIDVITSRDVLLEGWDSPKVVLELNLRPTYSRVVKTQMVGRVLRVHPGKKEGIVAEFQDIYRRYQQPLLVHHVFEQPHYRQGGLILAPAHAKAEEESRLKKREKVSITGSYSVSYNIKEVFRLERKRKIDFNDKELLREIVLSANGKIPSRFSKFKHMKFDHPSFKGNGETLLRKWSGIHPPRKQDYKDFLWHVFEEEMNEFENDFNMVESRGRILGDNEYLRDPLHNLSLRDFADRLHSILNEMDPIDAGMIKMYFGLEGEKLTYREIGTRYNLATERARKRVIHALDTIRMNIGGLFSAGTDEIQHYGLVSGNVYYPPSQFGVYTVGVYGNLKLASKVQIDNLKLFSFIRDAHWFGIFCGNLKDQGIYTLADLTRLTKEEVDGLLAAEHKLVVNVLEFTLARYGLKLGMFGKNQKIEGIPGPEDRLRERFKEKKKELEMMSERLAAEIVRVNELAEARKQELEAKLRSIEEEIELRKELEMTSKRLAAGIVHAEGLADAKKQEIEAELKKIEEEIKELDGK